VYETLLLDSMRGDATLFTRRDEVEAERRITTPIEEAWAQLPLPFPYLRSQFLFGGRTPLAALGISALPPSRLLPEDLLTPASRLNLRAKLF
jgi:hypothetical protein